MTLKVTVLSPTANIRREPTIASICFAEAQVGEQFDVIQLIDLKAPEQWAKIVLLDNPDMEAYICVTMSTGTKMCQAGMSSEPARDEYRRGWNECLEAIHRALVKLRK